MGGTPTLNLEWHAGAETDGDAAQPLPLSKAGEGSGNVFREGIFLDFVRQSGTTRAEGPHVDPQHVRRAKRNRIDHSRAHGLIAPPCAMAKYLIQHHSRSVALVHDLTIRVLTGDFTALFQARSAPSLRQALI